MSNDATPINLTRLGTLTMQIGGEIHLSGWEGRNCSGRDLAILALTHAIGAMNQELQALIARPGGTFRVLITD